MNIIVAIGPALTSVAALTQLGTVRRRPVFAFAVGLAIQPVWVAFSLVTHDYGFLIATIAFAIVNAYQLGKALRERSANRRYVERFTPTPSPFATRPGRSAARRLTQLSENVEGGYLGRPHGHTDENGDGYACTESHATNPGDHNPGTEDSHYAWQCAPQFPCWEPRAFGGRGAAPLTP